MKKALLLGAAALLMTASSAFAYTNEYAGYSINNKTPNFVMESSKIYGYMNLSDKNLHTVSCFDEKDMETVLGSKYTTAYFDESYAKLAVLDKNELDKSILNLPLLDLGRYAKLTNSNKAVLEEALKSFKEELKPEIRLDKIGGKKVITVNLLQKSNGDLINTDISLLSSNNKLYLLATGSVHELADKEKPLESAKEKAATKLEAVDRSKVDPAILAKFWKSHTTYVKAFKTIPAVNTAKPLIAYNDLILGKKVALPQDWSYIQYNHTDKKNPGCLSIALPNNTFTNMGEKLAALKAEELASLATANKADAAKYGSDALSCVEQVLVSGSVKVDKDKDLTNMLANPLATKLQADLFFKEGLKRLKAFGNDYIKLNDYKYDSDFVTNKGTVDVLFDITLMGKHDFLNDVKILATPVKGSGLIFITKKGVAPEPSVKLIYDKWSF